MKSLQRKVVGGVSRMPRMWAALGEGGQLGMGLTATGGALPCALQRAGWRGTAWPPSCCW